MESPLAFMQLETSCVILFILGLTIIQYLFNCWPVEDNGLITHTPILVAIASYNTKYYSIERSSSWTDADHDVSYGQVSRTPIHHIRGLKYLNLEQRALIMSGVRRRLDKQF
ncbi:uncharacterized protein LOC115562167 [Drosophila navojoa]|uniref:uncharacterized protein LOC115562167 n=1 Tax=Drosophila navojoa TaxID=7232 RepID=UPI0011BDA356|nr:uncharacterized protein LOC115562167 [Drosophila navojoa]